MDRLRQTPYLLFGVLVLGSGLGIGLGLSEAPTGHLVPRVGSSPATTEPERDCPAPQTAPSVTLTDTESKPTITLGAGTTFVVVVPPWSFGTATDIQFSDPSAVFESCSVVLPDRGRRAVFKALAPGHSYLGATVAPSSALEMPARSAEVIVTPQPSTEQCARHRLSVALERSGVAAGTVEMTLGFTNIGPTACSLYGYPDIGMLDAEGKPIPTELTTSTAFGGLPVPQGRVPLAPGATASFYMEFSDSTGYGSATCPRSTSIEVYPPASQARIVIPLSISPYGGSTIATLKCGEITVSPVFSGG